MIRLTTDSPLQAAIDSMDARSPVGSRMNSREWETTAAEVRDKAFWISTLEDERVLADAQRRIREAIAQQRDTAAAGGRVMERGRFVLEMQDILDEVGYQPDPEKRGTLQDLSSSRRLSLVYAMNLDMAQGFANWKAKQNEVSLTRAPAQELIRVEARRERRDWPRIWAENGGKFYGEPSSDYPYAPGRMMAPVNDRIWAAISRFDTPWPPFDWGSGMGLRAVRRRNAIELGVIGENDPPPSPQDKPFTANLRASVKGLDVPARQRIQKKLGDTLAFDGDEASYVRDLGPTNPHRHKTIPEELRDRAAEFVARFAGELPDDVSLLERIADVVTGREAVVRISGSAATFDRLTRALNDARVSLAFDAIANVIIVTSLMP